MDKIVETSRERFWYRNAWERDMWVREQARRLPPQSRVLDAGAGACKYRPLFAHCVYKSQDFCQYKGQLVEYSQPVDYVGEITSIPIESGTLDAILCTEVLEHVPDPMAVLKEFHRLLKPGGRVFLTAPQVSNLHMEPYHFYTGFTHYWYRHWLSNYGFQIETVDYQGGPVQTWLTQWNFFYDNLRILERKSGIGGRLSCLLARAVMKIPLHYLLPWALRRFEPRLDRERNCVGLMVAAVKK